MYTSNFVNTLIMPHHSAFQAMNFANYALGSQENILGGRPMDGSRMPRTKQRTVLGVLNENDQQSRTISLVGLLLINKLFKLLSIRLYVSNSNRGKLFLSLPREPQNPNLWMKPLAMDF